jgi:cell division protein FtsB
MMSTPVRRARIALLGALVVAAGVVATQFPLNQLLGERAAVRQESQQLTQLNAENRSLTAQIGSLHQPDTIARLAQERYGLVPVGDQSFVVLPSVAGQHASSSSPLDSTVVPKSDLVPSDSLISGSGTPGSGSVGTPAGFWSKLVQRLEFWKAVP